MDGQRADIAMADTSGRRLRVRMKRHAPHYRVTTKLDLRTDYPTDAERRRLLLTSFLLMRTQLQEKRRWWTVKAPLWMPSWLRTAYVLQTSVPKRILARRLRMYVDELEQKLGDIVTRATVLLHCQ